MATETVVVVEEEEPYGEESLSERFVDWVRTELIWYAGSFTVHLLLISSLLLLGNVAPRVVTSEEETVLQADAAKPQPKPEADPLNKSDDQVTQDELENQAPDLAKLDPNLPAAVSGEKESIEEYHDKSLDFVHGGDEGGGTPDKSSPMTWGPGARVPGRVGLNLGSGTEPGCGGDGKDFGFRGKGHRLGGTDVTPGTEKAVALALHWLMRHQGYDGSWSFDKYKSQCKDASCTGAGSATADAGATGLALLCYLAADQTHKKRCPYRMNVERGLVWLARHQERDGNLGKDCVSPMYSHAIATLALCEAYGMSGDRNVGAAAQGAVNFIIAAQNKNDYGWRYNPGDPGDTSVTGWQMMALKAAMMAGLNTGGSAGAGSVFESAGKWLDLVKTGPNDSQFQYQPGTGATPAMTAVGLLCRQYMHAKRNDPMMVDGIKYLMNNPPDVKMHNAYYWYYASQVLFNYNGYEWDTWNRAMRKLLIKTQTRSKTCADGSWDPENPSKDQWGPQGGRLMLTTFSCLTLEVYYRILPLYKGRESL
jgi:hypothetical protein